VVSVKEKADPRVCQVKSTETSVSEPLRTCRKSLGDVKTGGSFVNPGGVWEEPVYCPHGVRHRGGVTVLWASVWNVGTFAPRSRARDEGRPLGVDVPAQAPNPLTLLCTERAW
jgi:hypothetical protein